MQIPPIKKPPEFIALIRTANRVQFLSLFLKPILVGLLIGYTYAEGTLILHLLGLSPEDLKMKIVWAILLILNSTVRLAIWLILAPIGSRRVAMSPKLRSVIDDFYRKRVIDLDKEIDKFNAAPRDTTDRFFRRDLNDLIAQATARTSPIKAWLY